MRTFVVFGGAAALWLVCSLPLAADPASGEGGASAGSEEVPVACSYRATAKGPDGALRGQFLPSHGLFRPPIADVKQPRLAASLRRTSVEGGLLAAQEDSGGDFLAGVVSFGGTVPLYGFRAGHCNGVQIGLTAGVFSQFNLDTPSLNLINSDFIVGFPITGRLGRLSARLRLLHQSSHLGDEFILDNDGVDRENLSFEGADLLVSYAGDAWRIYGGGGYFFNRIDLTEPVFLQGGAEFRSSTLWSPRLSERTEMEAVAGVDVKSFQERDWGATTSLKVGMEAATRDGVTRRFRLLFVFLDGFVPFGQFFDDEKLTNFGGEVQYEF